MCTFIWQEFLFGTIGSKNKNDQIQFQIQLHRYTPLVCWYPYLQKKQKTFERWSIFQHRRNYLLKVTTIKGKNMLPIESIFFPLKVVPVRLGNNFKGH